MKQSGSLMCSIVLLQKQPLTGTGGALKGPPMTWIRPLMAGMFQANMTFLFTNF